MTYHEKPYNEYELSTGTRFSANNGIIGLSPELTISEGYDGGISKCYAEYEDSDLTQAELVEVADYMIEQWTKFRQKASQKEA